MGRRCVVYAYNHSTQVVEAKEFSGVKSQPGLPTETLSQNSKHVSSHHCLLMCAVRCHSLWMNGPCYTAKGFMLLGNSILFLFLFFNHIKSKTCYYHFEAIEKRIHMDFIFLFQKFHYRNLLLGEHDVPLTCIEQIVTGMWHSASALSES